MQPISSPIKTSPVVSSTPVVSTEVHVSTVARDICPFFNSWTLFSFTYYVCYAASSRIILISLVPMCYLFYRLYLNLSIDSYLIFLQESAVAVPRASATPRRTKLKKARIIALYITIRLHFSLRLFNREVESAGARGRSRKHIKLSS